jgi:hypothetical protein
MCCITVIAGSWRTRAESENRGFINLQTLPRRSIKMAQDIENTLFWTKEEFLGKVIMLKNVVNFLHDNKAVSYYIYQK